MNWNMICCICKKNIEPDRDKHGHIIWHGGHNPAPITDEEEQYACTKCNDEIVVPARIDELKLNTLIRRKTNE
jgi:hypothetical protein